MSFPAGIAGAGRSTCTVGVAELIAVLRGACVRDILAVDGPLKATYRYASKPLMTRSKTRMMPKIAACPDARCFSAAGYWTGDGLHCRSLARLVCLWLPLLISTTVAAPCADGISASGSVSWLISIIGVRLVPACLCTV